MTIKVSHESPIALLPESIQYNDYQYCLVHLMEEEPEYKDWFLGNYRAKRPDGEILLDNSIFELKEAFEKAAKVKLLKEATDSAGRLL